MVSLLADVLNCFMYYFNQQVAFIPILICVIREFKKTTMAVRTSLNKRLNEQNNYSCACVF